MATFAGQNQMKSKVVALVQARMGATRFRGKMLAELDGYPLLEWVLRRVERAQLVDEVVLATTNSTDDDVLVELAKKLGVSVCRGSEHDVLSRFSMAASKFGAEIVVRVCADNPLIDPVEIDRLVSYYCSHQCDYACNHQDRLSSCYADGFGAETLSNKLLQDVAALATSQSHREHVTLYLWDNSDLYNLVAVPAPIELAYPNLRFDVDIPKDLDNLKKLVVFGMGIETPASEIVGLMQTPSWRNSVA